MKFAHTLIGRGIPHHIMEALQEQPHRSGMYNWMLAFKGEIIPYWELRKKLGEYDVVQVNMSPKDLPIIPKLRRQIDREELDTKLVLNNDWVCERWDDWEIDPYKYREYQKMGDMVFGTEPHQVSQMVNGAYCLPHPTNTDALKHLGTDQDENSIGFIYHWWSGEILHPARLFQELKDEYGVDTKVFGFRPSKFQRPMCKKWSKIMFDKLEGLQPFPDYAEKVQGQRALYDPNPYHTYGRNGVEMACWKIPIVGSDRVYSYQKLFPDLTADPYDKDSNKKLMKACLDGEDWVKEAVEKAYEKVEYFNYENSKERFKKALKESVERGGHEWYKVKG